MKMFKTKKGIGVISNFGRVTVLCVTVSSRFVVFSALLFVRWAVFVLSDGPFFCCPGGCFFCCCHGFASGDMESYKTKRSTINLLPLTICSLLPDARRLLLPVADYLLLTARCQLPATYGLLMFVDYCLLLTAGCVAIYLLVLAHGSNIWTASKCMCIRTLNGSDRDFGTMQKRTGSPPT